MKERTSRTRLNLRESRLGLTSKREEARVVYIGATSACSILVIENGCSSHDRSRDNTVTLHSTFRPIKNGLRMETLITDNLANSMPYLSLSMSALVRCFFEK